jgi:hypothetical protein
MIQLPPHQAALYSQYLETYTNLVRLQPDASIRTEAFFCVRNGTKPYWIV